MTDVAWVLGAAAMVVAGFGPLSMRKYRQER